MRPVEPIRYASSTIVADDGAILRFQSTGSGPAVLIANGIGVTAPGLDILVDHLRARHRVLLWDYRGAGGSLLPRRDADVSMARHARDALSVLDAAGEQRAAVLGWSMGVPVGLEIIRAAPERVVAYGALFGAPGKPFLNAFPRPISDLVHLTMRFCERVPEVPQALLDVGVTAPSVAWQLCTAVRFVGRSACREAWEGQVRGVAQADRATYFRTMCAFMEHDARDLLPGIRCPVLVVAGGHDWTTPPAIGRKMAQEVPSGRYLLLPRTTHFGVIEHGPALWSALDDLLASARWDEGPERQRRDVGEPRRPTG